MARDPKRKKGWRIRVLQWHRQVGLATSFLMIILAVTGIILNHNADWGTTQAAVNSKWLLAWYDVDPTQIEQGYAPPLSWDRVLLDLHTGRFFGDWGVYLMDAAAIVLLLLTFTGIYNWYRSPRRVKSIKPAERK